MENKKRCEKCDSTQVYVRLRTKEMVCQKCGHIQPDETRKKKE